MIVFALGCCPARLLCAALTLAFLTEHGWAQTAVVSIVPDADSFVRSLAPTNNYGAGGALSVSGVTATNSMGAQNGLFDTLMRFPMSNVVATLEGALRGTDWLVTEARLVVNEMAAPDNEIFNRGVGGFEIRWLASNAWTEGTGKPNAPTSDGVSWDDLPFILNTNTDEALGAFTNSGANGQISFPLALAENFVASLHQGSELDLYLTASSAEIGFTFNSRNFGNTNAQPELVITASANPRPRIDVIELDGTNVAVRFGMTSNWNYQLQGAPSLQAPMTAGWSVLLSLPAQPVTSNIVFLEPATNSQRFYRLSAGP